jgi:hypothetical protein
VGAGVLVVFGVMFAGLPKFSTKSVPVGAAPAAEAAPAPSSAPETPQQIVTPNAVQRGASRTGTGAPEKASTPSSTAPVPASIAAVPAFTAAAPASAPGPASRLPGPPVIAKATGTLAVSSSTSVDVYKDDTYIGSVPALLKLPAGENTVEYRHGNFRKQVTHVINSGETTEAAINFEVTVQINSRPWAEVFIEGAEKKALGQTPLSNARVPIGGVLIFENPQFQTKKYRVVDNETEIQILFP